MRELAAIVVPVTAILLGGGAIVLLILGWKRWRAAKTYQALTLAKNTLLLGVGLLILATIIAEVARRAGFIP